MKTKYEPKPLAGDTTKKLSGRKCLELDGKTAAMLESNEIKAITGEGEEWWCPNPDCDIVDK